MQRLLLNLGRYALRREQRVIAFLVLVMLLGGIAYALELGDSLRYPDERDYVELATNLAHSGRFTRDGHTPTAYRAPGYPLLLAVFIGVGAPVRVLRVVNMAALAVSVWLVAQIARHQTIPIAGLIGVLLLFCYPVL